MNDFYPPHNSIQATHKALRELVDHLKATVHPDPYSELTRLMLNADIALNGSTSVVCPHNETARRNDTTVVCRLCGKNLGI